MDSMDPTSRLGEHEHTLTCDDAHSVLAAELHCQVRFGPLLHPHPSDPGRMYLTDQLLSLGRRYDKDDGVHWFRQVLQVGSAPVALERFRGRVDRNETISLRLQIAIQGVTEFPACA